MMVSYTREMGLFESIRIENVNLVKGKGGGGVARLLLSVADRLHPLPFLAFAICVSNPQVR